MHYTEAEGYGPLPFDPFKAIVAPRPVGWISTIDRQGRRNLAPYSFFIAVSSRPNMIGFASDGFKHTPRNARDTGEFVFSLATLPLLDQMNRTSEEVADGVDEFELAGLAAAPSRQVRPPRVAASPAALECKLISCTELHDLDGKPLDRWWVVGQVVATYIDDSFIKDGRFDTAGAQPLGRCGYRDYAAVTEMFELLRPTDPGRVVR
ncbi:MAG: flavin reductase family protein [Rhodobacter sp.]|nr:flavin reductase family protein [Paracoccaceae bacterium]MCC0077272.1 flavin reductase family protein [Rhodobacter sp.]